MIEVWFGERTNERTNERNCVILLFVVSSGLWLVEYKYVARFHLWAARRSTDSNDSERNRADDESKTPNSRLIHMYIYRQVNHSSRMHVLWCH